MASEAAARPAAAITADVFIMFWGCWFKKKKKKKVEGRRYKVRRNKFSVDGWWLRSTLCSTEGYLEKKRKKVVSFVKC